MQKRKEDRMSGVWFGTPDTIVGHQKGWEISEVCIYKDLYILYEKLRPTAASPEQHLALSAAHWPLFCSHLHSTDEPTLADNFNGRASIAVHEWVEMKPAGVVQSGCTSHYSCSYAITSHPIHADQLYHEGFSGRQLFSKQAWASRSHDSLAFAYHSKDSDLQLQEDRRKSHFWPRPIPTQTLLLTSSRYLAEAF